jgi:phosphopentomutase
MGARNDQRRAFVVVVDALGVGAEDDAAAYGDEGANTLLHLAEACGGLELPTLAALGLGNILDLPGVQPDPAPAVHGALTHSGPGKDSTSGHWELFGVVMKHESPTFAGGLPAELVSLLEEATGLRFCGGGAIDGIEAIESLGEHHLQTGEVILYTSVDSVVQLAAHEDVMPRAELYRACEQARAALTGPYAVGRVIARPFAGQPGAFERTAGRRDYALEPPDASHLIAAREAGVEVHSVGKVSDLFAGRGFDHAHEGAANAQALAAITRLAGELEAGIVVANLIETDQLYGHRKDVEGFHRALREIDAAVGGWLANLREGDLLVLTGDHGVDPAMHHSDHTREKVPLLAWHRAIAPARHDGPMADVGASVLKWCAGVERPELPGRSFV